MTFSKSNLNLLPASLFTELTADRAEMLEGGKRIDISIGGCKQPDDRDGTDESFSIVNDRLFHRNSPLGMGSSSVMNPSVSTTLNSTAKVGSFDRNGTVGSESIAFFKKAFKKFPRL